MLHSRQNGASAPAPTVLIVGTGLFAACELLRHGVKPRVVERRLAPHGETRGTALQPAVLEILDRAGLIEPFLRAGVRIRHIQLLGPGLREIVTANFANVGCEYEFQCSLPQWRTEAILREHLESLGLEIEFGTDVTLIEDDPAGLRVTLDTGGRTEVVTAAYVLGAGGGHSVTRHSMQEHLAGETYGGRYVVADVKVSLPCPPECGRVIVGPTGFGLFSPLPDDRWLIFVDRDEADTRRELPTAAELGALLNARIGVDVGLSDLLHGGVHFVMFPECIPVATLDRAIVTKWGANAKRVHEPKGNSEPRRADRLRVPMGRHPRLHHSTTATLSRSIRDRGCTHGPRHETGHAVPESNPKSRVGRRRAVARRADNQARAMAAIAVGERKNGSALTSEARPQWYYQAQNSSNDKQEREAPAIPQGDHTRDISCRRPCEPRHQFTLGPGWPLSASFRPNLIYAPERAG